MRQLFYRKSEKGFAQPVEINMETWKAANLNGFPRNFIISVFREEQFFLDDEMTTAVQFIHAPSRAYNYKTWLPPKLHKIAEYVISKHTGVRKYTGEPEWTHPFGVCKLIHDARHKLFDDLSNDRSLPTFVLNTYAIALLHDILEDTPVTAGELEQTLHDFDIYDYMPSRVTYGVELLTEVYTKEEYPDLNRKLRKKLELARMAETFGISEIIVKCADLVHNAQSIRTHDPKFWKVYKEEAIALFNLFHRMDKSEKGVAEFFFNSL